MGDLYQQISARCGCALLLVLPQGKECKERVAHSQFHACGPQQQRLLQNSHAINKFSCQTHWLHCPAAALTWQLRGRALHTHNISSRILQRPLPVLRPFNFSGSC